MLKLSARATVARLLLGPALSVYAVIFESEKINAVDPFIVPVQLTVRLSGVPPDGNTGRRNRWRDGNREAASLVHKP